MMKEYTVILKKIWETICITLPLERPVPLDLLHEFLSEGEGGKYLPDLKYWLIIDKS